MSGEGCRVKRAIIGPTGMTCELRFEERERLCHADSREKRATEEKGCANTLQQDPAWWNEGSAGRPVQGGKGNRLKGNTLRRSEPCPSL